MARSTPRQSTEFQNAIRYSQSTTFCGFFMILGSAEIRIRIMRISGWFGYPDIRLMRIIPTSENSDIRLIRI